MNRLPNLYNGITFLLTRLRKLIIRSIILLFRRATVILGGVKQQYHIYPAIPFFTRQPENPQQTTIAHTKSGHLAMSDWQAEYLHYQHILRSAPGIDFTPRRTRSIPRTSSRNSQQRVGFQPVRPPTGGGYTCLAFLAAVLAIMYMETRTALERAQDRLEIEMKRVRHLEAELHRNDADLEIKEALRRTRLKDLQVALKRKEEEFERSWDSAKELLHRKKRLGTDGCADIDMTAEAGIRSSNDNSNSDSVSSVD